MISAILQHFIKEKYYPISHQGFTTIKELDEGLSDISQPPKKDENPYHNWKDVPFDYLNQHFTGIADLNPSGFLFYTPAIMYQVLENIKERNNCVSVLWWIYNLNDDLLDNKSFKCISLFNEEQLFILIIFLQKLIPYDIVDEQKIIDIITTIESLILKK